MNKNRACFIFLQKRYNYDKKICHNIYCYQYSNIEIENKKSLFYSDLIVIYNYYLLIMISYHLPIQNLLKILPNISSVEI